MITCTIILFNKTVAAEREKNKDSFIHSFILAISIAPLPSYTQRRSRLQRGYRIGVSRRSAQAIVGKGLAQGPYMAARAGVEPTTLRLKAIDSTKAPPCPTYHSVSGSCIIIVSVEVGLIKRES